MSFKFFRYPGEITVFSLYRKDLKKIILLVSGSEGRINKAPAHFEAPGLTSIYPLAALLLFLSLTIAFMTKSG